MELGRAVLRYSDLVAEEMVAFFLTLAQAHLLLQTQAAVEMQVITVAVTVALVALVVQDIATLLGRLKQWHILQN
jgi:hypothetical protein